MEARRGGQRRINSGGAGGGPSDELRVCTATVVTRGCAEQLWLYDGLMQLGDGGCTTVR